MKANAIYYPNLKRLDFTDGNGETTGGMLGNVAHLKAARLIAAGNAIIINISNAKN